MRRPTTVPGLRASTISPELRAAWLSMPVPTIGDSVTSSGTACFCMFDPIERAVCVVVLEERDQRRGDADDLLR